MPSRSGQNVGISTYVSPEVKEALEKWAAEQDRSLSWLMAKILVDALENQGRLGKQKS
ncbi:MAG: toxin-antitoxin system HicB family antitoxin [Pseudanabaena frigida]|uniref:Toxin-antitoxin system HicB family antitoxin n=1 Tax=Pseudanabaena frigida TaxID=945775 RepID=A0A2W4Y3B4_9CYAN|nr:MAG: toxin-antitoxin system HicB family antitoxin [Pseudanabaena frigida]